MPHPHPRTPDPISPSSRQSLDRMLRRAAMKSFMRSKCAGPISRYRAQAALRSMALPSSSVPAKPSFNTLLYPATVALSCMHILSAMSIARSSTLFRGHTCVTRPQRLASTASMRRAVKLTSLARFTPTRRGSFCERPHDGLHEGGVWEIGSRERAVFGTSVVASKPLRRSVGVMLYSDE